MRRKLTPNPFPRGQGNQIERMPFPWWEAGPNRIGRKIGAAPRAMAAGAIAIYRAVVSPVIHAINGPACRFEPSCSEYAREAIGEYGIVRGSAMAIWRIARCNPMGGHGYDPVRGPRGRGA